MIGLDHFGSRVTSLRNTLLDPTVFPTNAVLAADLHPCDFLLPYINDSLRSAAVLSRNHGRMEAQLSEDRRPSSFDRERNQANYRNLMRSCNTISSYLEKKYPIPFGNKPRLAEVTRQYDALIAETRENAGQLQTCLQNYTSRQAILETKKGLEQVDAVRRYGTFP